MARHTSWAFLLIFFVGLLLSLLLRFCTRVGIRWHQCGINFSICQRIRVLWLMAHRKFHVLMSRGHNLWDVLIGSQTIRVGGFVRLREWVAMRGPAWLRLCRFRFLDGWTSTSTGGARGAEAVARLVGNYRLRWVVATLAGLLLLAFDWEWNRIVARVCRSWRVRVRGRIGTRRFDSLYRFPLFLWFFLNSTQNKRKQ